MPASLMEYYPDNHLIKLTNVGILCMLYTLKLYVLSIYYILQHRNIVFSTNNYACYNNLIYNRLFTTLHIHNAKSNPSKIFLT